MSRPAAANPLDPKSIFDLLVAKSGGDAVSAFTTEGTKDPYFKVAPAAWQKVARTLKETPELAFDYLDCVTAVDWIKQNILQVVYHLYSYTHHHTAVVKIDLPREKPQVPSAVPIWRGANWQEREQYDLLGVEFIGHPDLRRLLLPDDWVGHPMRKDYKEAPNYRQMPTTRTSTFDLLAAFDKAHAVKAEGGSK